MDQQVAVDATGGEAPAQQDTNPRSLAIAENGIKTGNDFARMMSTLMGDIISGRVTPQVGNSVCNAGGKLLKVVEMQYRYGKTPTGDRNLMLTTD